MNNNKVGIDLVIVLLTLTIPLFSHTFFRSPPATASLVRVSGGAVEFTISVIFEAFFAKDSFLSMSYFSSFDSANVCRSG